MVSLLVCEGTIVVPFVPLLKGDGRLDLPPSPRVYRDHHHRRHGPPLDSEWRWVGRSYTNSVHHTPFRLVGTCTGEGGTRVVPCRPSTWRCVTRRYSNSLPRTPSRTFVRPEGVGGAIVTPSHFSTQRLE